MPVLIQFFVISICFLITANVDDADGFFLETNSDTGKNNKKSSNSPNTNSQNQ